MMKIKILLFILVLTANKIFAQDSVILSKQTFFAIQAGAHYKTFLDKKYIKPTPSDVFLVKPFEEHQYERFTKIPTSGFSIGLLFSYMFAKQWGVTTGISYTLRKDIFQNDMDTVIIYGYFPYISGNTRSIRNIIKYEYSYNNIELPIMLQYSLNKFTLYSGCYISLITYKSGKYTYVIKQNQNIFEWTTSDKTISGWEMPLKLFPTIQANYDIRIKNIQIKPYIALYYALNNQNDLYVQSGFNFPLKRNP